MSEAVDAMLCRWAERKYGLHEVTRVDFDMHDDGAWSEVTPGDRPYIEIKITHHTAKGGRQSYTKKDSVYDTALIREIAAFACAGKRGDVERRQDKRHPARPCCESCGTVLDDDTTEATCQACRKEGRQ